MRKIKYLLIGLLFVIEIALVSVNIAKADNITYNYQKDSKTITIELLDDTNCKITIDDGVNSPESDEFAYTIVGKLLTISDENEEIMLEIQADNTLTLYVEEEKSVLTEEQMADLTGKLEEYIKGYVGESSFQTVKDAIIGIIGDNPTLYLLILAVVVIMIILLVVVIKYRKNGYVSGMAYNTFKEELKALTSKESNESREEIKAEVKGEIDAMRDTILKALVLAQDKSPESKISLINLLKEEVASEQTKEVINSVQEKVEQEIEEIKEVKESISGDYEKIW